MSEIIEIKNAVTKFLKENLNNCELSVIKIEKVHGMWNSIAEVYENDSFLKSMNLPPKKIRLFYLVRLDEKNEISSFERLGSYVGADGSVE